MTIEQRLSAARQEFQRLDANYDLRGAEVRAARAQGLGNAEIEVRMKTFRIASALRSRAGDRVAALEARLRWTDDPLDTGSERSAVLIVSD